MQTIIKKYANRKYYMPKQDTVEKARYVTLPDMAELIKDGHKLKIVDESEILSKDKADLTMDTLLMALTKMPWTIEELEKILAQKAVQV